MLAENYFFFLYKTCLTPRYSLTIWYCVIYINLLFIIYTIKNYKKYKTLYALASPGFGRTPDNYATSGIQIRQQNASAASGFYWINPQNSLAKPIYVYVDFDYRAGEAWVLVQSNRIDTRSLIDSYVSLDGVK